MNSEEPALIVEEGSIFTYRIFDVGSDINLKHATKMLEDKDVTFATLRKPSRLLLINERPVQVNLPKWEQEILGKTYLILTSAKIFSFGAISIRFSIEFNKELTMTDLIALSHFIETDEPFHQEAVHRVNDLMVTLGAAIKEPRLWEHYEDYTIFNFTKVRGLALNLRQSFTGSAITALILGEKNIDFAPELNDSLRKNLFQYGKNDLVLLHWNGALIYDLSDASDIAETIEYSLCQLLEIRYYDDYLEDQLNTLYQSIEGRKASLIRNPYQDIARTAALRYIDISEVVDRINNSFKVVGDFYYGKIYRATLERLRIDDWRQSVDRKLANLAEFSKLFQGEVNHNRAMLLEILIVVFFAIEIVHLFVNLIMAK